MEAYHATVTLAMGEYRVGALLAQGLTTHTVEAENAAGAVVGVGKRLVPRLRADLAARARLEEEAAILRALDGRGAPRLLAAGTDELGPWLVMERLAMSPLGPPAVAARLASTPRIARVSEAALRALAAVHEATDARGPLEVVHGDVTPDNLLVDADGGEARLVDFGLARSRDSAPGVSGALLGSVRHVAPEVARGEPATVRSDLFSLALSLLHAASGEAPRQGEQLAPLVVLAGETPVTAYAGRAAAGLPPPLRGALLAMLAFEPRDRPASAREAWRRGSW